MTSNLVRFIFLLRNEIHEDKKYSTSFDLDNFHTDLRYVFTLMTITLPFPISMIFSWIRNGIPRFGELLNFSSAENIFNEPQFHSEKNYVTNILINDVIQHTIP